MKKNEFINRLEDVLSLIEDDEEHEYSEVEVSDLLVEAGLRTLPTIS